MKFFKHTKSDFTIIINEILFNKALSTSEKGLLALMLALPDDLELSFSGLLELNRYGAENIINTLQNLEKKGFLKREQLYDQFGEKSGANFHVYGEPQKNLC